MATEMHRVHTSIKKIALCSRLSRRMEAIKVLFYDLLLLLIPFIYKKKRTKEKAVVGKNIYVMHLSFEISVPVGPGT